MASERQIARIKAQQAENSRRMQQSATQSPLGNNSGSRRSTTAASAPTPKPVAQPSTFGKGQTGLSASPGGLNVSPEELRAIQAAANAPAGTAAPRTIYIPGVGSVTVGQ